jgi:cytidine deaminase
MFQTQTSNKKIFDLLFEAASQAEPIQCSRHASAIIYKKQVLVVGVNSRKTHPLQERFGGPNKPVLHSETAAIVKVISLHGADILKRCSLWNLRLTKGGKVGISKPCASCQRAIDAFCIRKVFYTT